MVSTTTPEVEDLEELLINRNLPYLKAVHKELKKCTYFGDPYYYRELPTTLSETENLFHGMTKAEYIYCLEKTNGKIYSIGASSVGSPIIFLTAYKSIAENWARSTDRAIVLNQVFKDLKNMGHDLDINDGIMPIVVEVPKKHCEGLKGEDIEAWSSPLSPGTFKAYYADTWEKIADLQK